MHFVHEIGVLFIVLLLDEIVIDVKIESIRDVDFFFVDPLLQNEVNFGADTEIFGRFWQIFSNSFVEMDKILQELLVVGSIQTQKFFF